MALPLHRRRKPKPSYVFINDQIGLEIEDDRLLDDIIESIDDLAWSNPNTLHDTDSEIDNYHWNYFKEVVKHKARFLFSVTKQFRTFSYNQNAYDILGYIDEKISSLKLIRNFPKGTQVYRFRQHDLSELPLTKEKLASPPDSKAIYSNRMSPSGISMFYCSFEPGTGKSETIDTGDTGKPLISHGCFQFKKPLRVVDFTRLPRVPSPFDELLANDFEVLKFLHDFLEDLSAKIDRDGKEHIEYVPTQIVTEYIRYLHVTKKGPPIEGIIYPSSKKQNGKSCVLFFDHEESLEKLDLDLRSVKTEPVSLCP